MIKWVSLLVAASSICMLSNNVYAYGGDLCSSKSAGYTGDCEGEATVFKMTMKEFRFRKSNTDEFEDLVSNTVEYDFASVNAAEELASYLVDGFIPYDTYDAVSPILADSMIVSGSTSLSDGSGDCRTTTSGYSTDGGSPEEQTYSFDSDGGVSAGTDESASFGMNRSVDTQYMNSDGDFVIIDSSVSGFPLTVEAGDVLDLTMSISVAQSIRYSYVSGTCTGVAPQGVLVSLAVTVN